MLIKTEYIFRAGCKSPPAVKSASAKALNRCNSDTDSYSLDGRRNIGFLPIFYALSVCSGHFC